MIELCQAQPEQPVYHVTEPDAPDLYALISFKPGQTDPEQAPMTFTISREVEYEEVAQTVLVGRLGLLSWYEQNVGYSPDQDIGGLTPIEELIDRVASHMLLREKEAIVV
jgi:hypothetical protein